MASVRNLMIRLGVEVDKGAETGLAKFETRIGKVGALIGSAFAVDKIVDFGKQAFAEAAEAQKVGKLTEQVIKTTGMAARVTADHVGDLATAISNKTGIDDEAIQSGENLLLTFTRVRNETGKGNKIFDQATRIVTDMSKALGTDMKSSAIQVGKALNDPIKGISALTRVGVTFDAGQKKRIAGFIKAGDTMSAQKVILKELRKEFGGSAAAMATPADKAAVAWGNFKESVGTALMPVLDKVFKFLTSTGIPALQTALKWLQNNTDTVKNLGIALGGLTVAYYAAKSATAIFNGIQIISKGIMLVVNGVVLASKGIMMGYAFAQGLAGKAALGTRIQLVLLSVQTRIVTIATAALTLVQTAGGIASKAFAIGIKLVNAAMRANPVGLVVTLIVGLVAVLILAYKKSETFRNIVNGVWKAIVSVALWAFNNVLKPLFKLFVGYYTALGKAAIWLYQKAIKPAWDWIYQKAIRPNWLAIQLIFNTLKTFITHTLPNAFKSGVAAIGRFWGKVQEVAKKPVSFIVNTIYNNGIARIWNWVAGKVGLPQLPTIQGFERGGILGGRPSRHDNQLIAARTGEGILVPEAVKELGSDFVHTTNKKGGRFAIAKLLGFAGDPGGLGIPGFENGGIVGVVGGFFKKAKDFFVNGFLKAAQLAMNPFISVAAKTIGQTPLGQMLVGVVRKMVGGTLGAFKPFEAKLGGGGGMKAVNAARSQIGVPYSWGGGGPGGPSFGIAQGSNIRGFDCSGLMEYAWFKAIGKSIGGTTSTQKGILKTISGPRPGAVGQPHPGHTYMATEKGTLIEAPFTGARVRETGMRRTPWWGWPPWSFDEGGVWQPGTSGFNSTREPEAVFTKKQFESMGAGNVSVVVHVDPITGKSTYQLLKDYKRSNGGRGLDL
jgi:hypothetical protein